MSARPLCALLAALALGTACPLASAHPPAFPMSAERGPIRTVDQRPFKGPVSTEILAGPASGLNSAFVLYTRFAANAAPGELYALPVDHTYLVLSGMLNVQLGTDTFVAKPETLVFVPAGVPHRAWNAAGQPDAIFEVVAPAPSADLAAMMRPATPRKIADATRYVRVPPVLEKLAGGVGHDSLNERVLADRSNGSDHLLERLNDVMPGGGRTETHLHPFDQVYFIRKGTMTVQYGMSTLEAPAESLVVIPVGVAHNNSNTGSGVQSSITLLLPPPPKGSPMGQGVTLNAGNRSGG